MLSATLLPGEFCILDRPRMTVDRAFASCGSDEYGQTGMEKTAAVPERFIFQIPSRLLSISCAGWSTFLVFDGNIRGFLGKDHQDQSNATLQISENDNRRKIVAGDTFSIFLQDDNKLVSFNIDLPVDTAFDVFAKFEMAAIVTDSWKVIAIFKHDNTPLHVVNLELPEDSVPYDIEPHGQSGLCVLCDDGTLFVFENESTTHSHVFHSVVSIASTRGRTILLDSSGRIYELRRGRTMQVTGVSGLPIKVFAGGAHFGCVTYDGECYTWGCGTSGQLGNGTFLNSDVPSRVLRPDDQKVEDACAGEEHTVLTLINKRNFSCILPKIMRDELLPAGHVATTLIPHSFVPPEFDVKFY